MAERGAAAAAVPGTGTATQPQCHRRPAPLSGRVTRYDVTYVLLHLSPRLSTLYFGEKTISWYK